MRFGTINVQIHYKIIQEKDMTVDEIIESTKKLSSRDKAFLAHCLISSLETVQDKDTEYLWVELARKRYKELISGNVKPLSWEEIKKEIRS
jgi:hypothetical protein